MSEKLSRRQLLAASLCLPSVLAGQGVAPGAPTRPGLAPWGETPAWNQPGPLGNSGLQVARLGLGAGVLDPKVYRRAVEVGINYFNCFPFDQEEFFALVAEAVKPVRERVVLACGGNQRTRQEVLDHLDKRLKDLRTDRIDLWFLTTNQKPEDISDERLEAVRLAKQAGKIRACAISTHAFAAIVPRLLEVRGTVNALLVTCNFATWDFRPWAEAIENIKKVRAAGIGILAMKPLMGGLGYVPKERKPWADSLQPAARRQAALAAALKWVLRNEYVDSAPVAVDNLEEFERNVKAASEAFTEADEKLLAATVERLSPYYCRMCQRCEGTCRQALPVPDLMRFLMYAEGYRKPDMARRLFAELPARVRAARCEDCSACTVRCPNGVRVCERVCRAQAVLA